MKQVFKKKFSKCIIFIDCFELGQFFILLIFLVECWNWTRCPRWGKV